MHSLEKGRILTAVVEDISSTTGILLNFNGDLLRISNLTGQQIEKGQTLKLQVKSTAPLEFQIFDVRSPKFFRSI